MKMLNSSQYVACVMAIFCLTASNTVSANAGKVIYGYGSNYALDSDGNKRTMRKGAQINAGDTLVTGRGRMHVRLRDGGYVSVYPNSEYKIETFVYEKKEPNNAEEKNEAANSEQGVFSLLKGAARQVTGLLGKYNRDNFKFKTPIATIGIRGTGFFVKLCQSDCYDADGNLIPDGLYVKNNTGVITVTTDAGDIALAQGQSAFAATKSDSPQQVLQPPVVYNEINPDIEQFDFDEKVNDTSLTNNSTPPVDPVDPTDPMVTDPSVPDLTHLEYAASDNLSFNSIGELDIAEPGSEITQNGEAIDAFKDATGIVESELLFFDKNTATLEETGADTALGVMWNRWHGNYDLNESGTLTSLDNNIHLIGTNNISPSVPGAARGVVTYEGTGGTNPTITGNAGDQVGTQMVNAVIDYRSATVDSFNVTTTFSNATITGNLSTITNLTGVAGNQLSLTGSCTGTGCTISVPPTGASGNATLNLVGPNAEGIFGSYNLTNGENAVSGTYVAPESGAL